MFREIKKIIQLIKNNVGYKFSITSKRKLRTFLKKKWQKKYSAINHSD
jgi:hypothetical protein